MIYIYNSNTKYQKQIEYTFWNIFYILGVDYTFNYNSKNNSFKSDDILVLYGDGKESDLYISRFQNIISIKPSEKIFSESYLKKESVPNSVKRFDIKNSEGENSDIISIFNNNTDLYIQENLKKQSVIKTNIDIISDIFFMLTRYEEVVNIEAYKNEKFNRFSASESLAFKHNFLHRPIVNEHIDLLWNCIDRFNLGYKKKKWWGDKEFVACLTHDVDFIQKYRKFKNVIRPSANLFFKQKRPLKAVKNLFNYFRGYEKDPFYTFDYIINLEKSYNFKSSFYFMSGGNSEFDNNYNIYDKKIKELMQKIDSVGSELGYHCSFNSYNDANMLREEKQKLDSLLNKNPYGCRQHFLRFEAPLTWRYQEKLGLLYDTTLSYADAEGFRCGTCFPYKPYDLLEDRVLNIWEIPLIVMEGSLQNADYRGYTSGKGLEVTKLLIDTVRKHNGVFTILYHNSSFDDYEPSWNGWKDTYEKTMKYLYDNNCLGISGREIIKLFD